MAALRGTHGRVSFLVVWVRQGVVISDLHVGSRWGLFPPGFMLSTGAVYTLHRGQEYLLECWQDMQKRLPRRFDILIINGDAVDGQNPRGLGRDVIEPDPQWQVRAAAALLQPLAKRAGEVYVTQGSEYHVRAGAEDDEAVARAIGAIPDEAGHHAWDWLLLEMDGILLDVAHHRSTSIRYETMPGERELQFDRLVADLKGGHADLIIRSHGHRYVYVDVDGDKSLATPSWQLQTRYARRSRWPNRWLSRWLGGAALRLDGAKTGVGRIEVQPMLYPHPPLERRRYARA